MINFSLMVGHRIGNLSKCHTKVDNLINNKGKSLVYFVNKEREKEIKKLFVLNYL